MTHSAETGQFIRQGYLSLPNMLSPEEAASLARMAVARVEATTPDAREYFKFHGSLVPISYEDEVFAKLIAHPRTLETLRNLFCGDVRYVSGYIITKPPSGLPLWWHQDWWGWDEPESAWEMPPYLFAMYYLTDTTAENGCLRVIPGSHRTRLPLHDLLPEAHSDAIRALPLDSIAHASHAAERDVPVRAGTVIIGDARLLHATHANKSADARPAITLWYAPRFDQLSHKIQKKLARVAAPASRRFFHTEAGRLIAPLLPQSDNAPLTDAVYNRTPGQYLR